MTNKATLLIDKDNGVVSVNVEPPPISAAANKQVEENESCIIAMILCSEATQLMKLGKEALLERLKTSCYWTRK